MGDAEPDRRAAIRVAVLAYLGRHPNAADSLVGVCRWWLSEEGLGEEEMLVEDVLDELVAGGLLRRVSLRDGTQVYAAPVDAAGRRPARHGREG